MEVVTVSCGWDVKKCMPISTCPFCGALYPDQECEHAMGLRTEDKMDFARFEDEDDEVVLLDA